MSHPVHVPHAHAIRPVLLGGLALLLAGPLAWSQPVFPGLSPSGGGDADLPPGFTLEDLPGLMAISPDANNGEETFVQEQPAIPMAPPEDAADVEPAGVDPRDPFWPVGYKPPPPAPPPGTFSPKQPAIVQRDLAWPEIPLRGRSRAADGTYFALVDGIGVVRVGDDITLRRDGHVFHWRVVGIDQNGLQTTRLGVTKPSIP